jgi:ribosome biogenesis GTPase
MCIDKDAGGAVPCLDDLGWDKNWTKQFEPFAREGLHPARVICQHGEVYDLWAAAGELRADVSGRFRHDHAKRADWPVVGDWVAVAPRPGEQAATVHAVLPRRSRFSRKAAGDETVEQVVAVNVDLVFIVCGLDGDFNVRRLERYLTLAWDSGARPVIVLNKADLCPDTEDRVATAEGVAFGVPVIVTSAATADGLEALRARLGPGLTGVFMGSSGVGKSSLVNALLGTSRQSVRAVREDDSRGRHTTTSRELVLLPGGGMVIDTPGMRELQLWVDEEGVDKAFTDVATLAAQCRFADCTHQSETGCAVQAAVASGLLDPKRLDSYRKLQREAQYVALRQTQSARLIEKTRWKQIAQEQRRMKKGRYKP